MLYYVKYLCLSYDEKVVRPLGLFLGLYDKEVSKVGKGHTFCYKSIKERGYLEDLGGYTIISNCIIYYIYQENRGKIVVLFCLPGGMCLLLFDDC